MELHDAETMRASDAWAISEKGIPALRLMETAGRALAEIAQQHAVDGRPIRVVCGKGNNGGDGLVAARYLLEAGFEVDVLLLAPGDELSDDARANLARLDPSPAVVEADGFAEALAGSGVIVDAIFGTGFSDEPRSPAAEAIAAINDSGATVVAADIASAVDASTGEVAECAVDADATVTFHAAKIGHRIAPGKRRTGTLHVVDIGIPSGAPVAAPAIELDEGALAHLPTRAADSTKFSSGQVVIVGASRGLTGSVCLAAGAAMRAGAGYTTVVVPAELETIFEVKLTEAMSRGVASADGAFAAEALDDALEAAERAAAVLLGPGIGRSDAALGFARELAGAVAAPLVLDADGLNAHAGALGALAARVEPTVLTPHAGELARLLGCESEEVTARRLECARRASREAEAVVVLKGDDTLVVDGRPGAELELAVNVVPAPALATAGTGDVLGGMIAGLIARSAGQLDAAAAARAAVFAHARAGQVAAELAGSVDSVIASDVIDAIADGLTP